MIRTVYFDLETGGLEPGRFPVIQFAAVVVNEKWEELEALEMKIAFRPGDCDPSALAVNGYTAEAWANAERETVAMDKIDALMRKYADVQKISAKGKPWSVARVAAHNATFDCEHIRAWFKKHGRFLVAGTYEPLDTLALARWYSSNHPSPPENHKLETLCRWLDVPLLQAHDAMADIRATVGVAKVLCERMGIGACPA